MAPAAGTVPDAHDPSKRHAPMHAHHRPLPADRPDLRKRSHGASTRIREEFADAFAKAWYQADAPRHGADLALPGPARSRRSPSCGKTLFPQWIMN